MLLFRIRLKFVVVSVSFFPSNILLFIQIFYHSFSMPSSLSLSLHLFILCVSLSLSPLCLSLSPLPLYLSLSLSLSISICLPLYSSALLIYEIMLYICSGMTSRLPLPLFRLQTAVGLMLDILTL